MKKTKAVDESGQNGSAAERPVGVSQMVPYKLVRPDPNQPRKTFSEASLKELADSIREQGIVQRLILEFVPAKYVIHEPDLHSSKWTVIESANKTNTVEFESEQRAQAFAGAENLVEGYQIVCGERRWRAAGQVGLAELPADVYRGLTAKQRFDFQFVENNQRENVNALEEAAALKKQLEDRKAENAAFSPEDLAHELGMSRAAVYERLKLTRLHEPIRKALLAGEISVSVAGEVAKIPTPKAQETLMKEIRQRSRWQDFSVRDVQKLIDERYIKQLTGAPFDVQATFTGYEVPATAEKGPCGACRFRSGNMLGDFPELKSRPNVCTQPECFKAKVAADFARKQQELGGDALKTISEEAYEHTKSRYVTADETCYESSGYKSYGTLMGKKKPKPVIVLTDEGPKELFPLEEALLALKANGVKLGSLGGGYRSSPADKARELKKKQYKQVASECSAEIAQAAAALIGMNGEQFNARLWSLLAEAAYHSADIDRCDFVAKSRGLSESMTQSRAALQTFLKETKDPRALAQFTIEIMLCAAWNGGGYQDTKWSEEFLELATYADIKLHKRYEALKEAKATKPAKVKPHAQQKTLLDVPVTKKKLTMSASAKAHIAAAAKARWAKVKAAKNSGGGRKKLKR